MNLPADAIVAQSRKKRTRVGRIAEASPQRDATILVLALLACAFLLDDYRVGLLSQFLALGLMALSLDLIWGYAGILSFGQAAFFGLGAYGLGLMLEYVPGAGLAAAVAVGIATAAALAVLLGWFVFPSRVGLFFFAVITLAVGVILEQVINQFSTFTGGFNGIILSTGFSFAPRETLLVVLGLTGVALAALIVVVRSDYGRVLHAIRDDEERLRFLGYRTPRIKIGLLVVSGVLAGIGGVLYSLQTFLVDPTSVGFVLSTQAVIWVAIGGRGTLIGPLIGAVGINFAQVELSAFSLTYWQLTLGLLLIIVVLFAKGGLYPLILKLGGQKPSTELASIVTAGSLPTTKRATGAALETESIGKQYGSFAALSGVSLAVDRGELVCLIGPNGAGKSTLVDVVTGRSRLTGGAVVSGNERLEGKAPEETARRGVCRTFQAGSVFGSLTVFDNLLLACRKGSLPLRDTLRRTKRIELPLHVVSLIRTSGLHQRLLDRADGLSHGEKKWLELCMALAQEPEVLLLDEPTAGLTEPERRKIGEVLRQLVAHQNAALLLIEHDLDFVRQVGDRVVVLDHGRVAYEGGIDEAAASPLVQELYVGVEA